MLFPLVALLALQDSPPTRTLGPTEVRVGAELIGLELEEAEVELMTRGVLERIAQYRRLQAIRLDEAVFPALVFDPLLPGVERRARALEPTPVVLPELERPADLEELAYASIPELAGLLRSRRVSCVELTDLALARLVRLDEELRCVVTLLEERALAQAEALDRELDAGRWRGLLHGIPYGAKDLFAAKGGPTTYGAAPYAQQVIDEDASVIRRLEEAGAVLVAKLSLGELAMGDVWFGGTTKNPWKLNQGSSGSSAGSAAATAAGCVAFALGTETLGSIVSPAARCGNSALRPTFGAVPRGGAMALAWSMDKVGPLARSLLDAAIVFEAIRGPDGIDPAARASDFALSGPVSVKGWRVGYFRSLVEGGARPAPGYAQVLDDLRALEVELVPIELPDFPAADLLLILEAEAAAAFDEITRDGRDAELARQSADAWPNLFRTARLVPAVEYIRANRLRTELCRAMDRVLAEVELYVHPSHAGASLAITNLTGHPCAIAPCGFREDGTPYSICFTGQLHGESRLMAFAQTWQASTGHHRRHPELR